jgi:hypothetical protein
VSTDRSPHSLGRQFTAYFRSGWAFFIPYVAVYLLYYWRRWPANPPHKVALANGLLEGDHRFSSFFPSLTTIPLLHVYWVLHAIHVVLAAIALISWWQGTKRKGPDDDPSDQLQQEASGHPALGSLPPAADFTLNCPPSRAFYPTLYSAAIVVAPWFLLALVFYIPGVYLEWPSDPWEHFRRIAEWATHDLVGIHSAGYKSLYFLAYSFVGGIPAGRQLFWLNIYYTGMCLLLAWQYFLLAKAVGLSHRWAFFSVVVNVLTLGNVCFSFYRYYGLASTIFAQIGAVALTRVAILASQWTKGDCSRGLIFQAPINSACPERSLGNMRLVLMLLIPCSLLVALIAFNHVQGLGIAGMGIASIAVWRLIEWKRSMMLFLTAGAIALSTASILWWPRDQLIISEYRLHGWLNVWYGFNLFAWPSPAADRAMQILGVFGIVNLAAGFVLLRRNHLIGWLTVGPLIGLGLPLVAIPFCDALAKNGVSIIVFHRLLFAIPSGLSLTYLLATAAEAWEIRLRKRADSGQRSLTLQSLRFGAGLMAVAALVLVPSNARCFNRLWNTLAIQADDLDMASIFKISGDQQYKASNRVERVLCAPGAGFVLYVNGEPNIYGADRLIDPASQPSARIDMLVRSIRVAPNDSFSCLLVVPQTRILSSTQSMAGFLSDHWLPSEVALEYAGGPEYEATALALGYRKIPLSDVRLYFYQPSRKAN